MHLKNCLACEYWRGAGVAERGGLENRCPACGTESSNLSLSAAHKKKPLLSGFFINIFATIILLQLTLQLMTRVIVLHT